MDSKNENKKPSSILALFAFIGIGCIAVSLLLTLVLKNNTSVSAIFNIIGQTIAYLLSIIVAFSWVQKHRHVSWIVCYVVFVVTIVVLFILQGRTIILNG